MKIFLLPVFILTGIIFQFSSCDEKSYAVLIENRSSKPVSYVYNGKADYLGITYGVDNSKRYTVAPYTQPPKDINVGGVMSIKMLNQNGEIYTFVNIEESEIIKLIATNTLPVDVVLRNDKYIDFNGSTEMAIPAYGSREGKLYTSTVNFTLYPSQYKIDFNFNEERTAINVTIR
jgi:hypothetical protein